MVDSIQELSLIFTLAVAREYFLSLFGLMNTLLTFFMEIPFSSKAKWLGHGFWLIELQENVMGTQVNGYASIHPPQHNTCLTFLLLGP
jgi:hypothetical protein